MDRREDIERAGARLVFLGNGRPDQAAHFAAEEVPGFLVLSDPSRRVYKALGMARGIIRTLGPNSARSAAAAALRGHRQTRLEGDPWQQGGLLVLGPGGRILFLQRNQNAGDRPDLDAALESLPPLRK